MNAQIYNVCNAGETGKWKINATVMKGFTITSNSMNVRHVKKDAKLAPIKTYVTVVILINFPHLAIVFVIQKLIQIGVFHVR